VPGISHGRYTPNDPAEKTTLGAEDEARCQKVALMQDGRTLLWDEALSTWGRPESPQDMA
jgi:hypothetical protein